MAKIAKRYLGNFEGNLIGVELKEDEVLWRILGECPLGENPPSVSLFKAVTKDIYSHTVIDLRYEKREWCQ